MTEQMEYDGCIFFSPSTKKKVQDKDAFERRDCQPEILSFLCGQVDS